MKEGRRKTKKMLLTFVMSVALLATIGVSSTRVGEVSATFTHRWSLAGSKGLGSSPDNKQCGLWDDAPGSTTIGGSCAMLWLQTDNGGGYFLYENEWALYKTSGMNVDPYAHQLHVRFNAGRKIMFRVLTYWSRGGSSILIASTQPSCTWTTKIVPIPYQSGRIIGIGIMIDDYPDNSPPDRYMVLIDYIKIADVYGNVLWSEQF